MEHNNPLLSTGPATHDSGLQPQVAQDSNVQPSNSGLKRRRAISDLDEDIVPSSNQKRKPRRARKQRRKRAHISGPAFDATPTDDDPQWVDKQEADATFGPRPDSLARAITRPCYPRGEEPTRSNHYYRCIASSVCDWTQKNADRQLERIYKHAASCRALRRWKPELFAASELALANLAPGGHETLESGKSETPDTATIPANQLASPDAAPLAVPFNPFAKFDPTTNMTLFEQVDHTIARLICESGSPAALVDYPMWDKLLRLVGPQLGYSSPSASYLRDKLIPAEAARSVLQMREHLAGETNISLSFDGLTAGEQPVYTIHACTGDRRTFLYRADVFYGSHNTDYMVDLLQQVVNELGPHRISSIVSDDTNATKKARRLVSELHPSILNLADPVHKINLCIQDICADRLWTEIILQLRKLLTHFKMSTYAAGKLNAARKLLFISRGIQSIGRTRFATIYYAATSVLANLPALYKIYRDGEVDTTTTPLPEIVAQAIDEESVHAMEFRLMLTELVNILEPLARALLCLESTESTLGDVYFFWLAALAALNQHFASKNSRLPQSDWSRLQSIIYRRFNEAINEAPTDMYVTAFFMDPRYRTAAIYSDYNALYAAQHSSSAPQRPSNTPGVGLRMTESRYTRVRKQLFQMLRHELEIAESIPDHPLHQYDALQAKTELTQQLAQYHLGHPPFRQFLQGSEGTLQYWQSHCASRLTFILAYLAKKVFSVLPNSMCDERTGSQLTRLYSKLRTRMGVQSMTEQIQFSQLSAMIDGTDKLTRRKKSRPILRFQDIPEHQITHYTAPDQTDELEEDDGWLNRNNASMNSSITPDTNSIPSLNYPISSSHGVDITSQLLVGALSAAHTDAFSALLKPESSDSDGVAHSSTGTGTYIRAAEVCWDD